MIATEREREFSNLLYRGQAPHDYERQLFNDHFNHVKSILLGENPAPYEIEVQPTSNCNLNCEHCFGKSLTCKRLENLIGLEEFKIIARRISEFSIDGRKIETVKFCGTTGEPLVNPQTVHAVRMFKDIGRKVILYTNGLWLDKLSEEKVEYMNYFLEADKVNLSLDAGTEETFLDLKGVNGFTRTINNLRSLTEKIKRTGSKLRVDVSYVIGVKNYRDILRTTRLVKSSGADNIIFRVDFTNPIAITGLAPEVIEARTMAEKEDTEKFKVLFAYSDDEIREGKQSEVEKTKKCFNHNFWACIGPNRELYTCGHRTYSEVKSFGSLLDKSLLELWLSPERLKTVGNLPDENCKFCSPSCKRRDCLMNVLMCLPIDQVEELHDKYVLKPKIAREERKHGN